MILIIAMSILAAIIPHVFATFERKNELYRHTGFEVIILAVTYMFVTFNVVSAETNYAMGYYVIGFLGLYLIMNILHILIDGIIGLKNRIRKYCKLRSYRKSREKKNK